MVGEPQINMVGNLVADPSCVSPPQGWLRPVLRIASDTAQPNNANGEEGRR